MTCQIRALLLVGLLIGTATNLHAQVETGTPPFGSFGGGPEVIDLANLNLHLTIPVLHKAGRGTNFTYDLSYDSSIWYPVGSGGNQYWQPFYNMGWRAVTEAATGYISTNEGVGGECGFWKYLGGGQQIFIVTGYSYSETNWVYHDSFGVQHPFNGSTTHNTGSCTTDIGPDTSFTATSTDGSGYQLKANGASGTVTSSRGAVVLPPVQAGTGPASFTDRNGNELTVDGSGHLYDTLSSTTPVLTVASTGSPTTQTTFTYTAPSGASPAYTMNYTNYTVATNFGNPSIHEYKSTAAVQLVSSIVLPDGSKYTFSYEPTPGTCSPYSGTTCVTGRVTSIGLPPGGIISYSYTGGNNGILPDGSAATLTRTTPDGSWTYAQVKGTSAASTTTVTDPQNNQSVIQFQGIYETQRQVYQGSTSGTLLATTNTCYNGIASPCNSTAISLPITQRSVTNTLPGTTTLVSKHTDVFNSTSGVTTETDDYDYGSGAPGSLLRKILYTYASLGNITAFRQQVTVQNGSGTTVSQTSYNYDETAVTATPGTPQHTSVAGSRGNLTSINYPVTGLTAYFTYYDTGTMNTAKDVNGAVTTFNYSSSSCGNSFPISVSEPLSLSRSMAWNCTGGVQTSATDENNQTTTYTYNDADFWRINAITDPLNNVKSYYYQPNPNYAAPPEVAWTMTFNNGNSQASDLQYMDGLGRTYVDQREQSPGSSSLDSVSYTFDSNGRPYSVSMPCSVGWTGTCSTPKTTQTYDALNRPFTTTDGGNGTITITYPQNDVLVTQGPPPTGENAKSRQLEYDGLGRLTSVCEVTSANGSGACGQKAAQTGFLTNYLYDALNNLTNVTQNAQSTSQQTRRYSFDAMSRLTSETNAESGTTSYTYDTDSTCGTSKGDLVKKVDAVGNLTCYSYDTLHRLLSKTYPSGSYASKTPNKYFVYDSATVNSVSMANGKTRLVEAYTAATQTGTKITDLGMSYTVRGEPSDAYESTPNSGGYYHVGETYWANSALNTLVGPIPLPTFTFTPDGEGRISAVSASSGQNPVTNTAFNNASLPTSLTFGSTDSDSFTYDPNTERMTQYQFSVNGTSLNGALGWNANGSLRAQNITDGLNAADNQACSYVHDDLVRIASVNCTGQFLQNPGFESGLSPYWSGSVGSGGSFQLITDPTRAHAGNNYVQLSSPSGSYGASVAYATDFPAQPGNQVTFGGWVYLESGGGGGLGWMIAVKDASHTPITYVSAGAATTSGWQFQTATFTLPSGAAYLDLYAQVYLPTSSTVLRVDDGFLGDVPVWSQTFSYDGFGNIAKSGSATFAASYYPATNQISSVGGFTPTYDANGNTLTDPAHAYSWDSAGKPVTIDSVNITYDALGRMAEQNRSGVYTQFVYDPHGGKLAIMSGQTLQKAIIPVVGGAQAVYNASGLLYYGHSDHLGSIRAGSTPSRTVSFDLAYAPFSEMYAASGSTDPAFTGQRQDTTSGLYDFPAREFSNEGRWHSPDPAGLAAVDPTNPQSWNRYAYVLNSPLNLTDPSGMDSCNAKCWQTYLASRHQQPYLPCGYIDCTGASGPDCVLDGVETPCGTVFQIAQIGNPSIGGAFQIYTPGGCVGFVDSQGNSGDFPCQAGYFSTVTINQGDTSGGNPSGSNSSQPPRQRFIDRVSDWTDCVAGATLHDAAVGAVLAPTIGIVGSTVIMGAGGSSLGPEGTLAGAGLGFSIGLGATPVLAGEGAINGALFGVARGAIACSLPGGE